MGCILRISHDQKICAFRVCCIEVFPYQKETNETGAVDECGALSCENPTNADGYKHTHIAFWLFKELDTMLIRY